MSLSRWGHYTTVPFRLMLLRERDTRLLCPEDTEFTVLRDHASARRRKIASLNTMPEGRHEKKNTLSVGESNPAFARPFNNDRRVY